MFTARSRRLASLVAFLAGIAPACAAAPTPVAAVTALESAAVTAAAVPSSKALPGRPAPDALALEESSSTNTPGFRITLSADSRAHWDAGRLVGRGMNPCQRDHGDVALGALAKPLFDDLAAAGPLAQLPVEACIQPASFRTSTSLDHQGEHLADLGLTCEQSDPRTKALDRDAAAVIKAVLAACQ